MLKRISLTILIAALTTIAITGCDETTKEVQTEKAPAKTPAPVAAKPQAPEPAPAPVPAPQTDRTKTVLISTTLGDIKLELNATKAPITVKNFTDYANAGFYDGTIFHRVIRNFMIQGGGLTPDMNKKPTGPMIKNEASNGLKNLRGTIAMARTNAPDSATSQFFINHKDNAPLDYAPGSAGYAVFGKVIEGMNVVDAIASVPTTMKSGRGDVPMTPIIINSVKVID